MAVELQYTDAELREMAASQLGYASEARTVTYTTPGGQTVVYGEIPEGSGRRIAGRAYNVQYENMRQAIINRHKATGLKPATILNFLFIPLVVNSPMTDLKIRIPAAPDRVLPGEDDFSYHVWERAAFEVMQRGDKETKQPWDFYPIMLANTFLEEYATHGGVVVFEGLPTREYLERPDIAEKIQEAKQRMANWMATQIEEANSQWNTPNHSGYKNIVDRHRLSALKMKDMGLIDRLPDWVTNRKELQDLVPACRVCKALPSPGAVKCLSCGYIIDPGGAFAAGLISEEDVALERLTRAEVQELGISDFVAETSDEKPARLSTGRNRPLSNAQRKALAAEQEAQTGEPPII